MNTVSKKSYVSWVMRLFLLFVLVGIPVTSLAQESPSTTPQAIQYSLRIVFGGTPVMAYVGADGDIKDIVNPTLNANVGDTVTVTITNAENLANDFVIEALGVASTKITKKDETASVTFTPTKPGDFPYHSTVAGNEAAGMAGMIHITGEAVVVAQPMVMPTATVAPADASAVSIVRNPADVPPPVGNREPMTVQVNLITQEVSGILADGTTFPYFTFDGKVPGPFLRVRVGDTIEMTMDNPADSLFTHSIDLHAVTGPGGGAVFTQAEPGQTKSFMFKAIIPGLFVYHCASPSIPHHISAGMYGLILVEPEGGLPAVDHEFYVMEGEIYTMQPFGTKGNLNFSSDHMSHEDADYLVFNGAAGALTSDENALHANVGETVRIYFGVGGPNYISSFHVIGEMFDRVYDQGSLTSAPLTDVQTTLVPPGGATMVEFTVEVPGRYLLVDHALSRLERGLLGFLYVEGADQPDIFHSDEAASTSGH